MVSSLVDCQMFPDSVAPRLLFVDMLHLSVLIGITKCKATRPKTGHARLRRDSLDLCSQSTSALSVALYVWDNQCWNDRTLII